MKYYVCKETMRRLDYSDVKKHNDMIEVSIVDDSDDTVAHNIVKHCAQSPGLYYELVMRVAEQIIDPHNAVCLILDGGDPVDVLDIHFPSQLFSAFCNSQKSDYTTNILPKGFDELVEKLENVVCEANRRDDETLRVLKIHRITIRRLYEKYDCRLTTYATLLARATLLSEITKIKCVSMLFDAISWSSTKNEYLTHKGIVAIPETVLGEIVQGMTILSIGVDPSFDRIKYMWLNECDAYDLSIGGGQAFERIKHSWSSARNFECNVVYFDLLMATTLLELCDKYICKWNQKMFTKPKKHSGRYPFSKLISNDKRAVKNVRESLKAAKREKGTCTAFVGSPLLEELKSVLNDANTDERVIKIISMFLDGGLIKNDAYITHTLIGANYMMDKCHEYIASMPDVDNV